MSLSIEYYEYHLTPGGWIAGSFQADILGGSIEEEIPIDRVLTIRCFDELISVFSESVYSEKETWKCDDEEIINQLKEKYGKPDWFGYKRMNE
jgi:hypothetical protein